MVVKYDLHDLVTTDIKTALPQAVVAEIISRAPFVTVPGIFNLRDVSNASTPSSSPAALRPGLVYRAAAPNPVSTQADALNTLGIKKIFDLRRASERIAKPSPIIDGVEVVWVPNEHEGIPRDAPVPEAEKGMETLVQMYLNYLETHRPIYKAVFGHIRDEPETPFLFHCSGMSRAIEYQANDQPAKIVPVSLRH